MDAGIIVAIATAASIVGAALITALLGPIVSPWYSERLNKAQLKVSRRIAVRKMIESELSKGILDLGAIGAYMTALGTDSTAAERIARAQDAYIQMIINNETKFGVWLGYSIEEASLRELCEDYRNYIRDIRVLASQMPPIPNDMETKLESAKGVADYLARDIIGELNKLGW